MAIGLSKRQRLLLILVFFLLAGFPLFYNLDKPVVRLWDESRRGVNAYEMLHNGNWLVTHFDGSPEMWGTKPPLLIWLQVIFMKILGPGELALRLPSAIAALFTCLAMLAFSHRYLGNLLFGLVWALALVTANGYIEFHGARTGDFDALVTLFMLLYSLTFFKYLQNRHNSDLYLTLVFITLATLTKGIAGLLFVPALVIYAMVKGALPFLLRNKHTYLASMIFIVLTGGFYLAREAMNPGYLEAVWRNELGGRYFETVENQSQDVWFYIRELVRTGLIKWWPLVLPGIFLGFLYRDKKLREFHLFALLLLTVHFLIITFSETRLTWYNLPQYPLFAFFIAVFIWGVVHFILQLFPDDGRYYFKLLAFAFVVLVFYEPSRLMYLKIKDTEEKPWHLKEHQVLHVLREGLEGKRDLNDFALVSKGPYQHCLFYMNLLKEKGMEVRMSPLTELNPGDRVIAYEQDAWEEIERSYTIQLLDHREYVRIYLIK